jgi:hypothetical protein
MELGEFGNRRKPGVWKEVGNKGRMVDRNEGR